jgi:hypothetical protein
VQVCSEILLFLSSLVIKEMEKGTAGKPFSSSLHGGDLVLLLFWSSQEEDPRRRGPSCLCSLWPVGGSPRP